MLTLPKTARLLLILVLVVPASAVVGASPAAAATEFFALHWRDPAVDRPGRCHLRDVRRVRCVGRPEQRRQHRGKGGEARATISVSPGETIFINVGSAGVIPVGPSCGLGGGNPANGYGGRRKLRRNDRPRRRRGRWVLRRPARWERTDGSHSGRRRRRGRRGHELRRLRCPAAGGDGGDTGTNGADGVRDLE